jgi:IclR family acetate operon transcriptional repressor
MSEFKETRSAERVFAILQTFERERRCLSLKEMSEYCEIPVSTCHALVHTMLHHSYLYQVGRRKEFYPTRKLFDMASTIVAHDPVLQRITPVLENLRTTTEETIILGKRHKDSVLYLEVLEGTQTIRYSAKVGDKKPLHSTCIGKVLLGQLSPEGVRLWLEATPTEKVTDTTITSYARLIENLQEGNLRGYHVTRGENVADVTAIAAPIAINNELFGIAVAGPSNRMEAVFDRQVSLLLDAQAHLTSYSIAA